MNDFLNVYVVSSVMEQRNELFELLIDVTHNAQTTGSLKFKGQLMLFIFNSLRTSVTAFVKRL